MWKLDQRYTWKHKLLSHVTGTDFIGYQLSVGVPIVNTTAWPIKLSKHLKPETVHMLLKKVDYPHCFTEAFQCW